MQKNNQIIKEKAILVAVSRTNISKNIIHKQLNELEMLTNTAGAKVVDRVTQFKNTIDPATHIGKGKLNQLIDQASLLECKLLIFNNDLTPTHIKNIHKIAGEKIKIIDRTGLILDIFQQHARTKEAKTQVNLARLEYLLPRLTRHWTHLERQIGGIGTRGGPGETQIEIDRRLIRYQINKLKKDLEKIDRQRTTRRQNRKQIFKISLVGYTNAGKSTLMNVLSGTNLLEENKLFATLDTTTRNVELENKIQFLITDTVGFIRELPHSLVASFRSTLSEINNSDLIIKVLDSSSEQINEHLQTIDEVLHSLGVIKDDALIVLNKIDIIDNPDVLAGLKKRFPNSINISAFRKIKINELLKEIEARIKRTYVEHEFNIPHKYSYLIDNIYESLFIIERIDDYEHIHLKVIGNSVNIEKINKLLNDKIKNS